MWTIIRKQTGIDEKSNNNELEEIESTKCLLENSTPIDNTLSVLC